MKNIISLIILLTTVACQSAVTNVTYSARSVTVDTNGVLTSPATLRVTNMVVTNLTVNALTTASGTLTNVNINLTYDNTFNINGSPVLRYDTNANVFLGPESGTDATNTITSIGLGFMAYSSAHEVENGTALGFQAGWAASGTNNVLIGFYAGQGSTVNDAILIGATAGTQSTITNIIGIGSGVVVTNSNEVVLGNTDITRTILRGGVYAQSNVVGTDYTTQVYASAATITNLTAGLVTVDQTTNASYLNAVNTGGSFYLGKQGAVPDMLPSGVMSYASLINSSSTTPLQIGMNNAVVMTMLSGGYFGFGTTNPATKVDVTGSVRVNSGLTLTDCNITNTLNAASSVATTNWIIDFSKSFQKQTLSVDPMLVHTTNRPSASGFGLVTKLLIVASSTIVVNKNADWFVAKPDVFPLTITNGDRVIFEFTSMDTNEISVAVKADYYMAPVIP